MPRMSREQTELHRQTIIDTAARLFREKGLHGIGVADLMGRAGMTHGGFYGHFESRQALCAAACTRSFEQSMDYWRTLGDDGKTGSSAALTRFVHAYLSPRHRDHPGAGCAIPALAADLAREDADSPVRHAFGSGLRRMLDMFGALMPATRSARRKREQTLMLMATLVGAMTIARATQGDALSDEILDTVEKGLRAWFER